MLLTLLEAADELRVSPRTVERYIKSGKLPSIVLGSARRIDRDDLVAFVTSHREGGEGEGRDRRKVASVSKLAGPSPHETPETNGVSHPPRDAA